MASGNGGRSEAGGVTERRALHPVLSPFFATAFRVGPLRRAFFQGVDRLVRRRLAARGERPERVGMETWLMARALETTLERIFSRPGVSPHCRRALSDIFVVKVLLRSVSRRSAAVTGAGERPPGFLTIAPTNACNLACTGCYAGDISRRQALPFAVFDRLVSEVNTLFGSHFVVISGGEPFAYRDGAHCLLDLVARHPDVYFLAYTNGTLIDRRVARRLSRLGNLTPAISVEGFAAETDGRRGPGTHRRIMAAMDALNEGGVPFGISATPVRHNVDLLLSDEFIDFYFRRRGAVYGWYFQYMPIGRAPAPELMVTPEQRRRMFERFWKLVGEERLFIGDFWNAGTASDGCMAAGRGGGYFYVMWDGTVTPCVFVPFRDARRGNILDVYARGGNLSEVLDAPFFREIRAWQDRYWRRRPAGECGNLLLPCLVRDNCRDFDAICHRCAAVGLEGAGEGFVSLVEDGVLPAYNEACRRLFDPLWEKEYLLRGRGSG